MRRMVAMAVRHDKGGDVLRGFPADGSESLNEFAVRKTGVDQDAGGTGL